MKYQAVALAVLATINGAAASHAHAHLHHHAHAHQGPSKIKRVASPIAEANGAVATVYMLGNKPVSAIEVIEGIANGTFIWADGPSHAAPAVLPSKSEAIKAPVQTSVAPSSAPPPPPKPAVPSSTAAAAPSSSSPSKFAPDAPKQPSPLSDAKGVDADFPDGQLDCSTFPSAYGAVAVDYLGLQGWTGVQAPSNILAQAFNDIATLVAGQCPGGQCCHENTFCSYACPAGYQKSQWPSTQGATGQSVGGLQCKNGKLWLTNKAMSSKLCMTGATQVPVFVKNTMSEQASICRTDYPGTESETIPLSSQPGSNQKLTCPAADNYYTWQGKSTSAQYYVNPKGVGIQEACKWNTPGSDRGNYAPMNLGVGFSAGSAWVSIFQNAPTTNDKLDFSVELVGTNGGFDNLSGRCRYQNGQYCSGNNYDNCNSQGCTVSASSGSITYVLSD